MKKQFFGIANGGEDRLRRAIEAQVRKRHERKLAAADPGQKAALENQVREEINEEMKRVASPYCLWNSGG